MRVIRTLPSFIFPITIVLHRLSDLSPPLVRPGCISALASSRYRHKKATDFAGVDAVLDALLAEPAIPEDAPKVSDFVEDSPAHCFKSPSSSLTDSTL